MSNTNDLSNRINDAYSKLSKGQKRLATYITDNYDKAVFLTAAKRVHGGALCNASGI